MAWLSTNVLWLTVAVAGALGVPLDMMAPPSAELPVLARGAVPANGPVVDKARCGRR